MSPPPHHPPQNNRQGQQAKGVLAERLRVTPDEAFVTLRRYARDHNHPLTQLSGDVIRGTARITGDG